MLRLTIRFASGKIRDYDKKLIRALFGLVANFCATYPEVAIIDIPWSIPEMNDLMRNCILFLSKSHPRWIAKSKLYTYMLCNVGENESDETPEMFYARAGLDDLLGLRFALSGGYFNRYRVMDILAARGRQDMISFAQCPANDGNAEEFMQNLDAFGDPDANNVFVKKNLITYTG